MLNQPQIDDAVNKLLAFTGRHIAMPNNLYYGECTAPIAWYLYYLGLPIPSMHNNRADGWGVAPPAELEPYFSFEGFNVNRAYPRGSILMWDSPHIAVVLADAGGDNGVICFEQNADPDGAPCGTHTRILNNPYHHATYAMVPKIEAPQPTPPPYTVEQITPKQIKVRPGTHKWGMNYDNLPAMQANPIDTAGDNTVITVSELLHHNIGYSYYRVAGEADGWNVLDCDDYIPPPYVPPAAPIQVKMAERFKLVAEVPTYSKASNAQLRRPVTGKLPAGDYYVYSTETGMKELTLDNTKSSGIWVNPSENVKQEIPKEIPITVIAPALETPISWSYRITWLNESRMPDKFIPTGKLSVRDYSGSRPEVYSIPPFTDNAPTIVKIYGTITDPSHVKYYLLKLPNDTEFQYRFAVPMVNPDTGKANLLKQAVKVVRNRDHLVLIKSELEELGLKFVDSIIPKWYRKNNKNKKD